MKTIPYLIMFLVALFVNNALGAQVNKRIYILDEFENGVIHFRNKSVTPVKMNYDAANGELLYLNNETLMLLQPDMQIEYITLDGHKFMLIGEKFMEVISLDNGILYVDWKLKSVSKGKKGAYGQVSHTTNADHINISYWNPTITEKQTTEVFQVDNNNVYWIHMRGKYEKFSTEKSFIKLFTKEKSEKIRMYIKEHKLDMKNPSDVMKLVNYSLSIN